MSEPAPIVTPDGAPAREGSSALYQFWRRYGAAVVLVATPLQFCGSLYLNSTYAKKDDIKVVTQLVYDRTRPMNEDIAKLKSDVQQISTKLDERARQADERAKREADDATEIKRGIAGIETFLREPRR